MSQEQIQPKATLIEEENFEDSEDEDASKVYTITNNPEDLIRQKSVFFSKT